MGDKIEATRKQIVAPLARQLSWSHFVEVLPIKDSLARESCLTLPKVSGTGKRIGRRKEYERIGVMDMEIFQSPTGKSELQSCIICLQQEEKKNMKDLLGEE